MTRLEDVRVDVRICNFPSLSHPRLHGALARCIRAYLPMNPTEVRLRLCPSEGHLSWENVFAVFQITRSAKGRRFSSLITLVGRI